jgi:hypothetical protein
VEDEAVNDIGEGPAAAISAVTYALPGAPANLTAVGGNGTTTLAWWAPADGGSAITSYTVEQSAFDARTKTWGAWTTSTTSATTITKTGLVNGMTYNYRVIAKSKLGTGEYSAVVGATPAGPPTAPAKLTVKAKKGKFVIAWKAAIANGSPVTGYIVQYSANGKKWTTLKTTKSRTFTSKKGTKKKTYSFRVIAKNAVGKATPTAVVTAVKK